MFDSIQMSHDQVVVWALDMRSKVIQSQVVNAFVSSLSSRRLDLRSALGSYSFLLHFPEHHVGLEPPNWGHCNFCKGKSPDWNLYSFYRFQWGGLKFDWPEYAAFDLEQLLKQPEHIPTIQDWDILKTLLNTARNLSASGKLADLVKALAPVVKGNANERRSLLEVLGMAGILQPQGHSSYLNEFIPHNQRGIGPGRSNDWGYPIGFWKASDGVNETAVRYWFGEL